MRWACSPLRRSSCVCARCGSTLGARGVVEWRLRRSSPGSRIVASAVFRSSLQAEYFVFPFLVWAGWRFGQKGAAPAALLTIMIATFAALHGAGTFANDTLLEKMATLQVFNASVVFASIVLAALLSDRRRAEEELRLSQEQLSGLLFSAPGAILVVGEDGRIQLANPQVEQIFGYTHDELIGLSVETLVPKSRRAAHVRNRAGYLEDATARPMGLGLDLAGRRRDGSEFPVEIGLSSFGTPHGRLVTCIIADITQRKGAEEALEQMALHDPLTGLANRAVFMERLTQALGRIERRPSSVAILFVDLDHFKTINDSFGHEIGDRVLVCVGDRLRSALRPQDTASRFGGDEFVVLCEDLEDERHVIFDREQDPVVDGRAHPVGDRRGRHHGERWDRGRERDEGSTGGAPARCRRGRLPGEGARERSVRAVRSGDACPRAHALEHGERSSTCDRSRGAPSVLPAARGPRRPTDRTGRGARALGTPTPWPPAAERVRPGGRGDWVHHRSSGRGYYEKPAVRWFVGSKPRPTVGRFRSPSTCPYDNSPTRTSRIRSGRSSKRPAPSRRTFGSRSTETAFMDPAAPIFDVLDRLRELGVRLAIDDFGTGYSSLSHLRAVPSG